MPETFIIPAADICGFVARLMQSGRTMAPVRRADNACVFDWLKTPQDADLACPNPRTPPKQAVLPRAEPLFFYQKGKDEETIIPPAPPAPRIILGIHPCDARAIGVLDAVFSAGPVPDKPYMERRRLTTLVGRAFLEDEPTAFYRELGIDPLDSSGCDLFLIPFPKGKWLLEAITEKGLALNPAYAMFAPATEHDLAALADLRRDSASRVAADPQIENLKNRLDKLFDSGFWDRLHKRCVGCGACAFLCPTCHCFEIRDETRGNKGARARVWDTCQFDLFTRHASGHNPRSSQKERTRQRVMHKFSYGIEKFHIPFCVGCGRCIACCPAGNDLRQVIKDIREMQIE